MTKEDIVVALADYFADPVLVVDQSMRLGSISTVYVERAQKFFELRRHLGIHGYMTPEQARTPIRAIIQRGN